MALLLGQQVAALVEIGAVRLPEEQVARRQRAPVLSGGKPGSPPEKNSR